MQPETIDRICFCTAIIAPILLIAYFRWIGLALGVAVSWVSLVIAGFWLSALDPKREVHFLDTLWLLLGWLPSLLYAFLIFGIRELVAWLLRMCHNHWKGVQNRT